MLCRFNGGQVTHSPAISNGEITFVDVAGIVEYYYGYSIFGQFLALTARWACRRSNWGWGVLFRGGMFGMNLLYCLLVGSPFPQ